MFSSPNNPSVFKAPSDLINPDLYHPPLLIKFSYVNKPSIDVTHSYYDFKAGDYESISNFFNSFNWDATFSNYSINDAGTVFNDAILNSIKKFVPNKIFRTSKFPRWVSPSLKTMIKNKKYAHKLFKQTNSASDYSVFSELRAKCKRLSLSDYRLFISDTENYLSSNPSHFWKYTRDLKQHSLIPSSVHLSGVTADNPLSSANLFSKFFSSVFKPPLLSNSNNNSEKMYSYDLPSNCSFSCDDVLSALQSLKNNHSNGPDNISARLLYNCRNSLVFPLFILFRRSLSEGIFPTVWKTCSITPILKTGDPSDVSNYRPISILPHLA